MLRPFREKKNTPHSVFVFPDRPVCLIMVSFVNLPGANMKVKKFDAEDGKLAGKGRIRISVNVKMVNSRRENRRRNTCHSRGLKRKKEERGRGLIKFTKLLETQK